MLRSRRFYLWWAIFLISVTLIIIRTKSIGWLAGMDILIWIVAFIGLGGIFATSGPKTQ